MKSLSPTGSRDVFRIRRTVLPADNVHVKVVELLLLSACRDNRFQQPPFYSPLVGCIAAELVIELC